MKRFLTQATMVVAVGATLAGCAQSYQPVVDTRGHDTARYQQDLYECRQYAEQVSPAGNAAAAAQVDAVT
ncbi:MAG TPA: glycine zipper family protein, partial [Alphaproteobacteria bacterium]|nr:glycine zipper family protein [Alphaproteobacteria bacterium]